MPISFNPQKSLLGGNRDEEESPTVPKFDNAILQNSDTAANQVPAITPVESEIPQGITNEAPVEPMVEPQNTQEVASSMEPALPVVEPELPTIESDVPESTIAPPVEDYVPPTDSSITRDMDPYGPANSRKVSTTDSAVEKGFMGDLQGLSSSVLSMADSLIDFASYNPFKDVIKDIYQDPTKAAENANKIAYGGVRGVAGLADVATAPVWSLGHILAGGRTMPFSKMLESNYPETLYQFEEDPNSYADELLRFAQVGSEFVAGGVPMTKAATILTKGAYSVPVAVDAGVAVVSAAGYQGAKEAGYGEGVAFVAALVAPSSPQLAKAAVKGTTKVALKSSKWAVDTVSNFSLVGNVIDSMRPSNSVRVQQLKGQLLDNPDKWQGTYLKRAARNTILNVPDAQLTFDKQIANYKQMGEWANSHLPSSPIVDAHRIKMKSAQDLINSHFPDEDEPFKLTLDQIHKPIYKEMGVESGVEEVMVALMVSNEDAYRANILKNHEYLGKFLADNTTKVSDKDAEGFKIILSTYMDSLKSLEDTIVDAAIHSDNSLMFLDKSLTSKQIYEYPFEPMDAKLRPAMDELERLYSQAYEGVLSKIDGSIPLDSSPVARSITEIYETLGSLNDPKNIPSYVKSILSKIMNAGEDTSKVSSMSEARISELNQTNALSAKKELATTKLTDLQTIHKQQVADLPRGAGAIKARETLIAAQAKELAPLRENVSFINNSLNKLEIQKRNTKAEESPASTSIPNPILVNVDDVRRSLTIVKTEQRAAYRAGNIEEYKILSVLKDGLDESMEGLREVSPDMYTMFNEANSAYKNHVAKDFSDTLASKVTEEGAHHKKLNSEQLTDLLFTNASVDDIQDFFTNFDGTRKGLEDFLSHVTLESTDATTQAVAKYEGLGMLSYQAQSDSAVNAYKDVVFTSLARAVKDTFSELNLSPVDRLSRVEVQVRKFLKQHQAKLTYIPGMADSKENISRIMDDLGDYVVLLNQADDSKKLAAMRKAVGPGATIRSAAKNSKDADELANFLEVELPGLQAEGKSIPNVGEASANDLRRAMRNGLLTELSVDGVLNHKALMKLTSNGTETRGNLVKVLGENEVLKLQLISQVTEAVKVGKIDFTTALSSDAMISGLKRIGLPLERLSSMMGRRAVIAPSAGWVAGSVATRFINSIGQSQTSKVLKVLMDNPFSIAEMDKFVLEAIKDLSEAKAKQAASVTTEGILAHTRALIPLIGDTVAFSFKGHLSSVGIQMTQEEIKNIVVTSLNDDPRYPEETPKETPKTNVVPAESVEQPELTEEVIEQPEVTEDTPAVSPSLPAEATMSEEAVKIQVFKDKGIDKQGALEILASLGLLDSNNERMYSIIDEAYDERN
jgi:hypothetical protein